MNKRFKTEPYIRYANCYEDAETLLKVIGGAKTALSIASGGDNCLALLTEPSLESLTVFDRNPAQLCLTKLKFAAFKHLTYEKVLVLLGIVKGASFSIYEKLRDSLDDETQSYFDNRPELISKIGLSHCGKFEYYLNKIRALVIRFTQSRKNIRQFMDMDIAGQREFYLRKINNRRWRFITKQFFSEKTVGEHGRDKSTFAYANGDLYQMITDRMLLCFDNVPNRENIYLQYTVYGRFIRLPFYLRKENFETVKANIDKASFVLGDVTTVAALGKSFDFFNLSDTFEYMSKEETAQNEKMIAECANSYATVVFWNMLTDRQFLSPAFSPMDNNQVYEIYKNEKAYYYQALRIYKRSQGVYE
ncbi:MAG: BtaA family protein [Firmicutes bacterium]|nr:BtaA family protein [Bacillota bacterium]